MRSFHRVICPRCANKFTFKEEKEWIKESWLSRVLGKVLLGVVILLIGFIILAGMRGMSIDDSGVVKGFGSALRDQIVWVFHSIPRK